MYYTVYCMLCNSLDTVETCDRELPIGLSGNVKCHVCDDTNLLFAKKASGV